MKAAEYVAKHFPDVNPGIVPFGTDVMIQLRTVSMKTKSGLILVEETRDFNRENTMVGRIVKIGQLAFRNRETGELWPEGVWADVGSLVLVPHFGGFTFERLLPESDEKIRFCIFKDYDLRGGFDPDFDSIEDFDTIK